MRLEWSLNNEAVVKEFTDLGVRFPGKTRDACEKMANIIHPALIRAAPFDRKNVKYEHLKEVIHKTVPKRKNDNTYVVVWVSPRGYMDKHIYKIVVLEYGRSDMPAKPFWTTTVQANAEKVLQVGVRELKKAVENK